MRGLIVLDVGEIEDVIARMRKRFRLKEEEQGKEQRFDERRKRRKRRTFLIAAKKLSEVHASLPSRPLMSPCQTSTSIEEGRTRYMPLAADEPPTTLPDGQTI